MKLGKAFPKRKCVQVLVPIVVVCAVSDVLKHTLEIFVDHEQKQRSSSQLAFSRRTPEEREIIRNMNECERLNYKHFNLSHAVFSPSVLRNMLVYSEQLLIDSQVDG